MNSLEPHVPLEHCTIDPVSTGNIPAELRAADCFLRWAYVKNSKGKPVKCPVDDCDNKRKYSDTKIYLPFTEAERVAKENRYGLGISLKKEGLSFSHDGVGQYLWAFDLDGFIRLGGEQCDDGVGEILDRIGSYVEISPSTTGLKVFLLSDKPPETKSHIKFSPSEFSDEYPDIRKYKYREIEVFSKAYFLTITGNLWQDCYTEMRYLPEKELDELLVWLHETALGAGGAGLTRKVQRSKECGEYATSGSHSKLTPESLEQVLKHIDHYDEQCWSDTANALARAYGEDGHQFFIQYSRGVYAGVPYEDFSQDEVNRRFGRALRETSEKPDGYGVKHLVKTAKNHPEWSSTALMWEDDFVSPFSVEKGYDQTEEPAEKRAGEDEADDVAQSLVVSPITKETLNDASNAARFAKVYARDARYIVEHQMWILWKDGRWEYDGSGEVLLWAAAVARNIYGEALKESDSGDCSALLKWANSSLQRNRLEAMVKLSQPMLAISANKLDSDPWKLGVGNGLVDLKTGAFRDANPEDLITKLAAVDFDPEADCPQWLSMLQHCMGGSSDLMKLLQRAAGYSLSGATSEQVFFFLFGSGANGKSTFINTIKEIVGGYGIQSQPEVVMTYKYANPSAPTPEIARLAGTRLVAMVETEDGQRLAESRIKQMTGSDAITARVLHGTPFDFIPEFKLWLSGNHKPIIRGDDLGIWRRIVLIPFTVVIPKANQDKQLTRKLRAEYSGILNWMIAGCLKWQKRGLQLPAEIQKGVDEYKSDMDLIHQWLDEKCLVKANAEMAAGLAYQSYSAWAKGRGHVVFSNVRFAGKLKERGFKKKRNKAGAMYIGFGIRPYPGIGDG